MQHSTSIPTLRIALEWFLNPDHLPLIHAQEHARTDGALNIELIVPDDHYDGFEALAKGDVEVVINEPLHLLEKHGGHIALQSLGTFFHTDGGVLITHEARERLATGGAIRVASPVSNPVTDGLCRNILIGWMERQGRTVTADQIAVYEAGFDHVENLIQGADAAWLAFANIEGVHVKQLNLAVDMCTTDDGGVPGFSALELIVNKEARADVRGALKTLVRYLDAAVPALKANPAEALALWCRASQSDATSLTAAMVNDTLTRFIAPITPEAARWQPIWEYMQAQQADVVDAATFKGLFSR